MKRLWIRKEGEGITHDHHVTTLYDGEGWWEARVRSDGCLELYRYHNEPYGDSDPESDRAWDNTDHIHLCDINDAIARLQALKEAAQAHFGKEWPNL